ncbi:MAG: outer membrane protein assembly factor BamD [Bacteroidales bacterium]|nr:outer membrane protein assembly factor BamD [Bacteroidales bacterium]MBP5538112.1 outer membrane protein assembly factor BamD [Bacteroidales bacterium]
MKILKLFPVLLALLLTAAGCKTEFDVLLASGDSDAKYDAAFEYFNSGQYRKAATLFESMSLAYSGTARDDTVQFYRGLCNYMDGDYDTAEANLNTFITNFHGSPFTENATFLRVKCLYDFTLRYELDQVPTNTAITAISEYIIEFPENKNMEECKAMLDDLGERLDRKAYENAKLYYKMEDYLAAMTALRNVLKDDSDNIYREDILYYTAMASYKYALNSVEARQKDRYLSFVDDYYNFIGEFAESSYRKELDTMYKRALNALGRFNGSAEELEGKEKEFEKERQQLLRHQQ